MSWILLLVLTCLRGDSSTVAPPLPEPKTIHIRAEYSPRMGPLGPAVTREGESSVRMTIELGAPRALGFSAHAEWMSLGPPGPWITDTTVVDPGQGRTGRWVRYRLNRLRVTYGRCEGSWWMVIDELVTVPGDSRRVSASYLLGFPTGGQLWEALGSVHRVYEPDPPSPPIIWRSPTSFAWLMRADTLVVEQVAGPVFSLTLRARVR